MTDFSNENMTAMWDDFMQEGLTPVGRVHINVKSTNIREKTNDKGEDYRVMGIQVEIDRHEEIPIDTYKPERAWLNFYFRGKTVQRFRDFYKALTGRPVSPSGRDEDTGKPFVNYSLLLEEMKGLACYGTIIWRKDNETQELQSQLGWNFAQELDSLNKPQNPFLKKEEEEEEGEE